MSWSFIKHAARTVILQKADTLLGEWTTIESKSLDNQPGVEGPTCFEFHPEDIIEGRKYALLLDNYGARGYYYMTAESLANGDFTKAKLSQFSMGNKKARHGTVIRITESEYNAVLKKYGNTEQ